MIYNATGSQDIVSSIHFMKSGELVVENTSVDLSAHETASLSITQEFLMYALERDDWLMHFLEVLNSNLEKKQKDINKSHLTLIEGGLSD